MRIDLAAEAFGGVPVSAPRPARTGPHSAYPRTSRREKPLLRSDDTAFGYAHGRRLWPALQMRLRSRHLCLPIYLRWDCRQHFACGEYRRPVDHPGLDVLRMRVEVSATRADEVVVDAQLDGLVRV